MTSGTPGFGTLPAATTNTTSKFLASPSSTLAHECCRPPRYGRPRVSERRVEYAAPGLRVELPDGVRQPCLDPLVTALGETRSTRPSSSTPSRSAAVPSGSTTPSASGGRRHQIRRSRRAACRAPLGRPPRSRPIRFEAAYRLAEPPASGRDNPDRQATIEGRSRTSAPLRNRSTRHGHPHAPHNPRRPAGISSCLDAAHDDVRSPQRSCRRPGSTCRRRAMVRSVEPGHGAFAGRKRPLAKRSFIKALIRYARRGVLVRQPRTRCGLVGPWTTDYASASQRGPKLRRWSRIVDRNRCADTVAMVLTSLKYSNSRPDQRSTTGSTTGLGGRARCATHPGAG